MFDVGRRIYTKFIVPGADCELNLSAQERNRLAAYFSPDSSFANRAAAAQAERERELEQQQRQLAMSVDTPDGKGMHT